MAIRFEFNPFPQELYSAERLLEGFDPSRPETFADTLDIRVYRQFVKSGGAETNDYLTAVTRSLHDTGITQRLRSVIDREARGVVAIMGGHNLPRADPAYAETAKLAAMLTRKGFLVATGGGPGAMEAAHLGAALHDDRRALDWAINQLLTAPGVPPPERAARLVGRRGAVNRRIAREFGEYLAPAFRIARQLERRGGLGVPTWLYGNEALTPFAAHIAKYFQNSIREDGLLAIATHGIIYVRGGAGTLQEVFQDAAQNYYHLFPQGDQGPGFFSPMVFFGKFWRSIRPVLRSLFKAPKNATREQRKREAEYKRLVLFTDSMSKAVARLDGFRSPRMHKHSASRTVRQR